MIKIGKKTIKDLVFESIVDYGLIGIHAVDTELKTLIYNDTMSQIEGMDPKKIMGKNIFVNYTNLTTRDSTFYRVIKNKEIIERKTQTYKNLNGEYITTINSTLPLYENGEIVGAVELANNITDVKELSDMYVDLKIEYEKIHLKDNNKNGYGFDDLIGDSKSFTDMIEIAKRASKVDSSVLIYGETGTGKELVAQSIHYDGKRRNEPFIAQNCAAIPDTLLESILFGTEEGSFTGALSTKGIFEQANGGTLLLDEINSMSTDLQAKLLRVLQENYIRRIGGTEDIPIDVRIIATTNQDPTESIEQGIIRKDLYYRLGVITITIPQLVDRRSDILLLTDYFIDKYNSKLNMNIKGLDDNMKEIFLNYSWPGNVRELENAIEAGLNLVPVNKSYLSEKDFITTFLFDDSNKFENTLSEDITMPKYLENVEKKIIKDYLEKYSGNITKTAEKLGISRQSLQYKLKKLKL